MKNALRLLAVIALAAAFFAPRASAQDTTTQDNEARAAQYQKFLELYKGTPNDAQKTAEQQKQAYEIGKDYVARYSSLTDPGDVEIVNFVKGWVTKYAKADRDFKCRTAIDQGNFNEAVSLCRQQLAEEPESVRLNLVLGRTGYLAVSKGNKAAANEALGFIRRTAQLIESGKTTDIWAPFAGKDDTLGWLSYMEGLLLLEGQPDAAAKSLLKAAQSPNSAASKEPSTYDTLAFLYRKEYQKAAAEYQQKFPDGTEITPERKPEYDRLQVQLDKIKDRIIDAQARFVALSTRADQQAEKNKVMTLLTAIYKDRHNNSDAGLKELIAGVLSKPIMVPGQEPEPTPAAMPTTTNTMPTTGNNPQTSQTARPAGAATPGASNMAKPAATTPQPKPATNAPSTTPSPVKPKPISKAAGAKGAASGQ